MPCPWVAHASRKGVDRTQTERNHHVTTRIDPASRPRVKRNIGGLRASNRQLPATNFSAGSSFKTPGSSHSEACCPCHEVAWNRETDTATRKNRRYFKPFIKSQPHLCNLLFLQLASFLSKARKMSCGWLACEQLDA